MSEPLGIYIHWPFCESKCPYCDFNSHVRETVAQTAWCDALLQELRSARAESGSVQVVRSVFFGGGTPSLMAPETVAALINGIREIWAVDPDLEITLEANPSSVEAGRFAGFAAAGVNRVSIGAQSLEPKVLAFLGRRHDARQARDAIALARETFPQMSLDLISALPGQGPGDWARQLREALGLAGGHLSLYQLSIEPGTGFAGAVRRGAWKPLGDDAAAALFELTQEITAAAGLPAYEISNHARPGSACQHNLIYWRMRDYVGIGPGAHGRVTRGAGEVENRVATQRIRLPERWLAAVRETGHGMETETPLRPWDQALEFLVMGLRLREGVDLNRLQRIARRPVSAVLDETAVARLAKAGMLTRGKDRLAVSDAGRLTLNAILAAIVADDPKAP